MKTAQELENLILLSALEMYEDIFHDCSLGEPTEEKAFADKFGIPADVGALVIKGVVSKYRDLNLGVDRPDGSAFDGLANYIADRVMGYIAESGIPGLPAPAPKITEDPPKKTETSPHQAVTGYTAVPRLPDIPGVFTIWGALPEPWDDNLPGGATNTELVHAVLKASPEPIRLTDIAQIIRARYPYKEFSLSFPGTVLNDGAASSTSPIEKVAPGLYRYAHDTGAAPGITPAAIPFQGRNLPGKKPSIHVPALDDRDIGDAATWPTMITQVLRDSGIPMSPAQIIAAISLKYPSRKPISKVISTEISKLSRRFDSPVTKVKHGVYKYADGPKPLSPSDPGDAQEEEDDEDDDVADLPTDDDILESGETVIDYVKSVGVGRDPTLVKCNQCPEYLKPRDIGEHKRTAHPIKVRA